MCSGARGEWGYGDGTHGGEPRGSMQEETTEPPGVGAGHKLLGICLEFKKKCHKNFNDTETISLLVCTAVNEHKYTAS